MAAIAPAAALLTAASCEGNKGGPMTRAAELLDRAAHEAAKVWITSMDPFAEREVESGHELVELFDCGLGGVSLALELELDEGSETFDRVDRHDDRNRAGDGPFLAAFVDGL